MRRNPLVFVSFAAVYVSLVLLTASRAPGQSFSAEIVSEVFYGESNGKFAASIQVLSGTLKTGDEVTAYAGTGRKFKLRILSINVDVLNETSGTKDRKAVAQARSGETVWAEFFTADNTGSGSDYLTKGFKIYPKGFVYSPSPAKQDPANAGKAVFSAMIDGKPFKAALAYKGALLSRRGVERFQERPFLQISFTSNNAADNRILLFWILNPTESAAVYTEKDIEVNFSGAVDGTRENTEIFGFKNGEADTKFTVEITAWKKISPSKALISGKINGELREVKLIGRAVRTNRISGGVFENVEVEIFEERSLR
jgi:hypothetical protein